MHDFALPKELPRPPAAPSAPGAGRQRQAERAQAADAQPLPPAQAVAQPCACVENAEHGPVLKEPFVHFTPSLPSARGWASGKDRIPLASWLPGHSA